MRLVLRGHDCLYSAEQILLLLFPQERPELVESVDPDDGNCAIISVKEGERFITATTRLRYAGKSANEVCALRHAGRGRRL